MKVVILAAGVGDRLMPLTRNTPKSLLDLGDGYTMLERQLEAIAACGVESVRVVTGYRSAQIEAKVLGHRDPTVEITYNPFYRLANNIASAWLGLRDLDPPIVLLNGDDIFTPSVLERLLGCPGEAVAVVSQKAAYDEEDMKVALEHDGSIARFGKDVPADLADGEAIGMTLFRGRGLRELQREVDQMMRDEANFGHFYEAAYQRMIADGVRFDVSLCAPEEWSEIDFRPDIEAVRSSILRDLPAAGT